MSSACVSTGRIFLLLILFTLELDVVIHVLSVVIGSCSLWLLCCLLGGISSIIDGRFRGSRSRWLRNLLLFAWVPNATKLRTFHSLPD